MRIGMEKTVPENHRQQGVRAVERDLLRIQPVGFQHGRVVRRDPRDAFHHQQPPGGVFQIDFRDINRRIVFEHLLEPQDIGRFVVIVQLIAAISG